jgi:hypothetical protein
MPLIREILNSQVLPRYFVKIDEHMYIHELDEENRRFAGRGDVTLARGDMTSGGQTATQVLEAPAQAWQPEVDVERLSFLEIRDRENRQLVTVLELLSPTNKRVGKDRSQYLAKVTQLLSTTANFVEIDLLRGGPRMPWRELPGCDYYALVSRVNERPRAGVWPIRLRERLPVIPVPLREGDADARLDLQEVLHRIYDAAGYGYYIYTNQPEPPLSPEDTSWAQSLLPQT